MERQLHPHRCTDGCATDHNGACALQQLGNEHYVETGSFYQWLLTEPWLSGLNGTLIFIKGHGGLYHWHFVLLNYLYYSKHLHILLFPNTYYSKLEPMGEFNNPKG